MPAHPHCHWRDAQEWRSEGMEMSTPSDIACKMYDASLTQIVGFYDDPAVGGLKTTIDNMLEADPAFILGQAVKLGMSGKRIAADNGFANDIYKMVAMADQTHVKPWERKHAHAVKHLALGEVEAASFLWEEILMEHPRDMLSFCFLIQAYGILGGQQRFRHTCAGALPFWKPHMPFYGNVLGIQSFGFEEANFYKEAEKLGMQALDINRHDTFANHSISHVKEMTGKMDDGISFMLQTESNWNDTNLACHIYWHWALYYMEKNDFETALSILDDQMMPRLTKHRNAFNAGDAAVLLTRLRFEGLDLQKRWDDVFQVGQRYLKDHKLAFYDIPALFGCFGAKQIQAAKDMIESVQECSRSGRGDIQRVYREVGLPVIEAIQAFEEGDYDRTVELLKPIRYNLIKMGGSHAQRDIIILLLIHAAIRSSKPEHQKLANTLLLERKSLKEESPMADRLLQLFVNNH